MTEDENKIIEALRDERWDYRTAEGIAEQIGIKIDIIKSFLDSNKDIVWKSAIPDRLGRDLYTLLERKPQSKDLWRNISTFISKSSA